MYFNSYEFVRNGEHYDGCNTIQFQLQILCFWTFFFKVIDKHKKNNILTALLFNAAIGTSAFGLLKALTSLNFHLYTSVYFFVCPCAENYSSKNVV